MASLSLFIINYDIKTAQARGRKGGGRKFQLTKAQVAMQNSDTGIEELSVTILTVIGMLEPKGKLQ